MFRRGRPNSGQKKPLSGPEMFHALRTQLISGGAAALSFAPTDRFPRAWGVLMEQGMSGEVASLISLMDGSTSLYTSTGGGVIGAGEHAQVRDATHRFLDAVEVALDLTTPSLELPFPQPEEVRFNVLTFAGGRTASATRSDLADPAELLGRLFAAANEVITELRLLDEAGRPRP